LYDLSEFILNISLQYMRTLLLIMCPGLLCIAVWFGLYYTDSYWHWGDYWKLFSRSWKYSRRPSASGNISNYGEIIFNSHR